MLRLASRLRTDRIAASDGLLGVVNDVLFDDQTWALRWLVVDTGDALPGRKVLLPPSALGHLDEESNILKVRLTKGEIKASPDIDTDAPVSRRMESELYAFYGWNPYWNTYAFMGDYGFGDPLSAPLAHSRPPGDEDALVAGTTEGDVHLRSLHEMTGYHIVARDGSVGHVRDALINNDDWTVRFLVVETGHWWAGHRVLISPRQVIGVHWSDRAIDVDVDQETVRTSPPYDPEATPDRGYGERHRNHYARSREVA
jgi:uncharacterized protein YrrD